MTTQPKISIITPSFNSQRTIARTIESVLSQSYDNIEYIIMDGGSNDSTVEIVQTYIPKYEGKLQFVTEKDHGMYDAMNKGILRSSGELIGILNSDDWYEADAVESMVSLYAMHNDSVLYGILRYMDDGRESMVYRMHHTSLEKDMITHPTCFVPKKIYDQHGLFNVEYRLSADYELMLRFKKRGVPFVAVDKIIANFSIGGLSTVNYEGLVESFHIRNKYGIISNTKMRWEMSKLKIKALLKRININA